MQIAFTVINENIIYEWGVQLITQQQHCTTSLSNLMEEGNQHIKAMCCLLFLPHMFKFSITCWSKQRFNILYSNYNIILIWLDTANQWLSHIETCWLYWKFKMKNTNL